MPANWTTPLKENLKESLKEGYEKSRIRAVRMWEDPDMRAGITLSVTFHVLIFYVFLFGAPGTERTYELDVSRPISVEVVDADALGLSAPKPPPRKSVAPAKAPAPPSKPKPVADPVPLPEPVETTTADTPEPPKEPEPSRKIAEPAPLAPILKDVLDEPEPDTDFSSVLKAVKDLEDTETTESPFQAPTSSDSDAPLSDEVVLAIKETVERCWAIPAGARNAENLIVEISMSMNPDGSVRFAEIVDKSRAASDPFYRTAAESALRAVYNPNCNPLPVPLDAYDKWRNITLRFNPREMLGL